MKIAPGNFVKAVIFSLLPALLLFAASELGLRLFRFQYSNTPVEMRAEVLKREGAARLFTETENASVIRFKKDPKQLWVPAEPFAPGISVAKKPGVYRIAALGCSCTAGCVVTENDTVKGMAHGWTSELSYPGMLGKILEQAKPGKFEVINAGVGGHSSFQGLQRFKNTVLPYKPDMLFIYYGWNDHWLAPQEDKNAKVYSAFAARFVDLMEQSRVYQLIHLILDKINHRTFESRVQLKPVFRVSVEDYRSNLEAMVHLAQLNNIRVFLMTAPYDFSNFKPDRSIFPFDSSVVTQVHSNYNQVVREVAQETHTGLIDLKLIVEQAENKGQKVMSGDGVHLRTDGCRWIAENLASSILQETENRK